MTCTVPMPRLILLSVLLTLSGCFSLGRDAPSEQFYVLGGSRLEEAPAPSERLAGLVIGLRPLQIAEYLETPLLVVRLGPHQIRYAEFHRWAEELGGGGNRAVAGHLAARAPFEGIDIVPWPPQAEHDYLIQLHLLRFEGLVPEGPASEEPALEGSATAEGAVHLLATWEIMRPQDGAVLLRGTTDYRVPDWRVGDYEGLVTRLDAGLGVLADDLVAGLETLVTP